MGMIIAPAINTGTFGVAPQDAGVASATVTVGQMLGGSVGTSLLNTIFASAVASYLTAHLAAARIIGHRALTGLALAHGYDTAFWWIAGIFAVGAVVSGILLRPGPLVPMGTPVPRTGRGANRTSPGRPRPSGMIPQFLTEVPDQSGRSDDRPPERRTLIPQHPRRQLSANHRDPVTPPHLPGGKPGSGPPPGRNFSSGLTWASEPGALPTNPTEGRSSVSTEQRENLEAILRQSAFPADIDVNEQRRLLRELTSAQPLPADVTVTAAALGGVPTAEITIDGIEPRHVVLYFHGGVYVLGDAFQRR